MEGSAQYVAVGQPQPCPPPDRTRQDFAVSTNFGDGTVNETPFQDSDPFWIIGGRHAYRRAGTYDLVGTITDRLSGKQEVVRRMIRVPNAPLSARRSPATVFAAGRKQRVTVARFHDGNRLATATDYTVSIRWGDGARSNGTVAKRGRVFLVRAAHRYATTGRRNVTVVIRDDRNAKLLIHTTAVVRP